MGRLPKQYQKKDGSINLRIDVPPSLLELAKAVGILNRNTREPAEHGMWILLRKVGHLIDAGKLEWLGDVDVERLAAELKLSKSEATMDVVPIEKLHRSSKLKSGFVGVFANGTNFRAQARVAFSQVGSKYIGGFKSADEAAFRRREYYLAHKLPYGEYELETDSLLNMFRQFRGISHNQMRNEVLTQLQLTGRQNDYANDGYSFLPPEIDETDAEDVRYAKPTSMAPLRPVMALKYAEVAAQETAIVNKAAKAKAEAEAKTAEPEAVPRWRSQNGRARSGPSPIERAAERVAQMSKPAVFDDVVAALKCSTCDKPHDACTCSDANKLPPTRPIDKMRASDKPLEPTPMSNKPFTPPKTFVIPPLPEAMLTDDYVPGTRCFICMKANAECRCP